MRLALLGVEWLWFFGLISLAGLALLAKGLEKALLTFFKGLCTARGIFPL